MWLQVLILEAYMFLLYLKAIARVTSYLFSKESQQLPDEAPVPLLEVVDATNGSAKGCHGKNIPERK